MRSRGCGAGRQGDDGLRQSHLGSRSRQRAVECPQRRARERGAGEEMDVDPAETASGQLMALEERESLTVLDLRSVGQGCEKSEYLTPIGQAPARDLAHDEGMTEDLGTGEEPSQANVAPPEMVHPDRGVDQRHAERRLRRRRGARRDFCVPPSAARRSALARAIKASMPACKRAVFSLIPVNRRARSRRSSSRFNVVRICLRMHEGCR